LAVETVTAQTIIDSPASVGQSGEGQLSTLLPQLSIDV